ncbi:hypothetical protein GRI62_11720 [Erythrobacter arachoides]|uniref:Uncharacterized protein n=1 Tax=Aurantiacibacter arachoides TaxID=1850444 RepID=A0A845A163_9SPHN|nr:hypothetical protein [Aurantiacibacter arachoides]MXO94263.1 hypothetical protein [Aurantiacibacter arachoides]GGD64859.1 hypothetical protein GCM10011411_26450 [Aurantiacibacter arachoides]
MARTTPRDRPTRPLKGGQVQIEFDEIAALIRAEVKWRREQPDQKVFEKGDSYFKRESYALIRRTISRPGGASVIKAILRHSKIVISQPSYQENQFYWGLRAIDPHFEAMRFKQYLSRFSKQLLYSHRNGVPPIYLIGFLYQSSINWGALTLADCRKRDPSLSLHTKLYKPQT